MMIDRRLKGFVHPRPSGPLTPNVYARPLRLNSNFGTESKWLLLFSLPPKAVASPPRALRTWAILPWYAAAAGCVGELLGRRLARACSRHSGGRGSSASGSEGEKYRLKSLVRLSAVSTHVESVRSDWDPTSSIAHTSSTSCTDPSGRKAWWVRLARRLRGSWWDLDAKAVAAIKANDSFLLADTAPSTGRRRSLHCLALLRLLLCLVV